jgi:transcriptional antiterminator RfaH
VFEISPTGRVEQRDLDYALSSAAKCDVRAWVVVHTRPRQEKALATDLAQLGILHYLPLLRAHRAYRTKKAFVELPLFPGYVFLFAGPMDRHEFLRTGRVVGTIDVHDQDQFRCDIEQVRRLISSPASLSLYPRLKVGSRCRVTTGPLKGILGVVVASLKHCRFYVAVNALGQSVSLEIDAAWLEPVD